MDHELSHSNALWHLDKDFLSAGYIEKITPSAPAIFTHKKQITVHADEDVRNAQYRPYFITSISLVISVASLLV